MDLFEKIRTLPTQPGVYLYKNADGEVIYVGKAKNLRSRVRSYLLEASQANAKTGSLSHVNALSCYGQTQAGKRFVFSIFCNNHNMPGSKVLAAIDSVVQLLVPSPSHRTH